MFNNKPSLPFFYLMGGYWFLLFIVSFASLSRCNKMAEPIIKSRRAQKEVNGMSTEVVCTEFSNYIFVVLTQYGKIGTLISVTPDSRSNDIGTPTFSTKVLLGKDEVCWVKLVRLILYQCDYRLLVTWGNSFHAAKGQMTSAMNYSGRL